MAKKDRSHLRLEVEHHTKQGHHYTHNTTTQKIPTRQQTIETDGAPKLHENVALVVREAAEIRPEAAQHRRRPGPA
jgi:hypothetical protein